MRFGDFITMLEQLSGVPMPKFKVPYWLAYGGAVLNEFWSDTFSGVYPLAPISGVVLAGRPMHYDCTKAKEELGMPQNSIRKAIYDMLVWFDKNGFWEFPDQVKKSSMEQLDKEFSF